MRPYPFTIATLISKYLRDELTDEENVFFQQWLEEKEENRQLLKSFLDPEAVQGDIDYVNSIDVEAAWVKVRSKQRKHRAKVFQYARYAAALLLMGLAVWLIFPINKRIDPAISLSENNIDNILPGSNKAQLILSDGRKMNLSSQTETFEEKNGLTIVDENGELNYSSQGQFLPAKIVLKNRLVVPKAGTYRLVLADGTKVWVNASSELRFPVQFGDTERTVSLTGEAYFEVAKDAKRPFIVELEDSRVEVLGTHFNINSYNSEVLTTLLEGSVKISNDQQERLLVPGQQAMVQGNQIKVEQANLLKAVAWKNGEFYFKKDGMADIMKEIARWYDLEVDAEGLRDAKEYSGSISRNSKLSEVLEMLQFVSGVTVEVEGRTIRARQ